MYVPRSERAGLALSKREKEVVLLIRDGLPNKLIASKLGISDGTVKEYLYSIFGKVGVTNRTELALWAQRRETV